MSWTQKREAQFLDALYVGVRDRADFDASLHLLGDLFDVESCMLLDFDSARPSVSAQASVGIFSGDNLALYQREFAHLDPAPPAFMTVPMGTATTTYRLLPEETRKPGVFFGEYYRPIGLEECLGGTLASSRGRFAMVGLQRPADRKVFDDDDIARLEFLMPHLARALQLRRGFIDLEARNGALSELCDRLAAGVIALDERGRSLFVNAAGRRMAASGDGLSIDRGGRPVATNRDAARTLGELEANVRSGGAGGFVRVPRAAEKPPYAVMVAPFALQAAGNDGQPRGVLFVVHDPLGERQPSARMIGTLLGLPGATARMVAALLADQDPKTYAERAGISMNTVRYHLKTAYARTGTRRQSELVRLVARALRDLSDHRSDDDDPPQ